MSMPQRKHYFCSSGKFHYHHFPLQSIGFDQPHPSEYTDAVIYMNSKIPFIKIGKKRSLSLPYRRSVVIMLLFLFFCIAENVTFLHNPEEFPFRKESTFHLIQQYTGRQQSRHDLHFPEINAVITAPCTDM